MQPEIHLLLHDIRSAHNVGSIFRTSDAIGVSRIYLSGHSPSPTDKFKRPVKEITKTALGAELSIPWEYHKDPTQLIEKLKGEGYSVVAIEQDSKAVDYKQFKPNKKILVVVGNEVDGVSEDVRTLCDVFVEIPMHGKKESLNVAVAYGIAMFRMFDV